MKIKEIISKESKRQKKVINLIPSENYVSKKVLAALGSPLTNKYAEGKSHHRYYFGNEVVDLLEDTVKQLACRVFRIDPSEWGVNVQAYSGSIANLAVYTGLLNPGDRVLAMGLEHGGHLTHGHTVSLTGKLFQFSHYGVNAEGYIDLGAVERMAAELKPKLIVAGASAYPRQIDFEKFSQIAKKHSALLMADISHIAGLVAAEAHQSPFPYADVVTTTTQKTLRGPRGAMIFSRSALAAKVDKAVFPGLIGGPHMHTIAAIGVALEEALEANFKKYIQQVVTNASILGSELQRLGFKVVTGGTDNHMLLVDVRPFHLNGKEAGEKLEQANIIVNKNVIPGDTGTPNAPSGIRLGTPAVTTQGMKEKDMIAIAHKIKSILQ